MRQGDSSPKFVLEIWNPASLIPIRALTSKEFWATSHLLKLCHVVTAHCSFPSSPCIPGSPIQAKLYTRCPSGCKTHLAHGMLKCCCRKNSFTDWGTLTHTWRPQPFSWKNDCLQISADPKQECLPLGDSLEKEKVCVHTNTDKHQWPKSYYGSSLNKKI